ncbi:hypothetical protein ROSEINA2194_03148 [Roseburia inulinivorans DSM 16841]|uniref:Uncharacterized protein n=1 Tax=Roseburia inulinivorans DSM 16841 TaxID=622312 RepID=C0FWM1_9FIRM|nr:hypothetical protein ROSEINA2194_03148 [Roseburia inulinivorans DSM 16841]
MYKHKICKVKRLRSESGYVSCSYFLKETESREMTFLERTTM